MSSSFTRAGTILEHQNFRTYIKQLDTIEKEHEKAFSEKAFRGASRGFDRASKSVSDYESQIKRTSREQQQFTKAITAAGAAFVAREVFQFASESVDLAREQAAAEAQLAAGIQSTGAAAGLSSNELKNLASELQGLTNFGDEATIQMEALLLTFTNIRENEFRRAVPLIQDVAARMGTDLNSAALQVGKALNAPTQNLDGLSRAGIQFSDAQKQVIADMVEANNVAGAQAIILDELQKQFGGSAQAAREADGGFTALSNSFGDFREQLGALIIDLSQATGVTEGTIGVIDRLTNAFRGTRAELGLGSTADAIAGIQQEIADLERARDELQGGGGPLTSRFLEFLGVIDIENDAAFVEEQIAKLQAELEQLNMQQAAEDAEELAQAQEHAAAATEENVEANEELAKALQQSVRQAESLAINFARAQEDAARKAARQTAKLERDQARAREKLLDKQQKQLDDFEEDRLERLEDFEEDRLEQIADTEKDIAEEERRAQRDRQRQQERFQRQLRQAEDRFNLDRIQSQRRFTLEETRLRAEGDILGLQRLREDFALQEQEASENFDLQQRQAKENQEEQTKDQEEEQRDRLAELKQHLAEERVELEESLDEQRADLLESFDEQLADLQVSQLEQREALAESLAEQEEDRRISQQRQIEDLGRSLAAQEDLTAEGAAAIAQQLEEAFGEEGIADQIMTGFTMRQESAFQNLFESIVDDVKKAEEAIADTSTFGPGAAGGFGANPSLLLGQVPGFQEGGIVPGATGSPQLIMAHGGETVLPTHQQQFTMPIAAPGQLNVSFGGRSQIDVTGLEGASQATIDAAVEQMIEIQDIAIRRILRRSGVN